jgi:hypothetical protein
MAWVAPQYSNLTIKGYILNMDDGTDTTPVPVYNGETRPDILTYQVGNLKTGYPYRFTVQAVNVNGKSQPSPISTYYACAPPS